MSIDTSEEIESIARKLYSDWGAGTNKDEPRWEDLPEYRQSIYIEWVKDNVLSKRQEPAVTTKEV
jgi:hypothetical protein